MKLIVLKELTKYLIAKSTDCDDLTSILNLVFYDNGFDFCIQLKFLFWCGYEILLCSNSSAMKYS